MRSLRYARAFREGLVQLLYGDDGVFGIGFFFFQAEDGIRDVAVTGVSDVCSSDLFVAAARAVGAGPTRVIFRHVLPNAAAPIIVSAALGIGNVILLEAGLSFLGIGVPSPLPSWGSMIHDGWQWIVAAPWTSGFPGLAIAFVVMALNAVGDGLRDALDPRKEGT